MVQKLLEMCLCKQSNSEPIHPATSLTGHLFWVIVNYTKHPRTRYQATKKGSSAPTDPWNYSNYNNPKPAYPASSLLCHRSHNKDSCPRLLLSVSVSSLTLVLPIVTLYGGPCLLCLGNCGQASSFMSHFCVCMSFCCCSVAQSFLTLCDPMDGSMPGFPVLHHLPELAQTHVHWNGDAIQSSHPLSSPSPPAFDLSQHQGVF